MRVIVIGMNPSNRAKIYKNSTLDRVNGWMTEVGVAKYSFMNCIDEIAVTPAITMVDPVRFEFIDSGYTVLALGGFVSSVLRKFNIDHYQLPHPSPRNRKFNDKSYEPLVMKQLKKFIQGK